MFCFYRCGAHESQDAMTRSPDTALLQVSHVAKANHVVGSLIAALKSRDKIKSRDRSAARKTRGILLLEVDHVV